MVILGGLIQQIGVVLALGGLMLYLVTIVYRMAVILGVRILQREVFLVGFYARAAAMVGFMGALTGGIIKGTTPGRG